MLSVDDFEKNMEGIRDTMSELNNMLELLEYLEAQSIESDSSSPYSALRYMTGQIYTQFDVSYDPLHMMVERLNDERACGKGGAP
jgi:hypothetical protein